MFIALEGLFNGGIDYLPIDCEFDFSTEEFGGVFPFTTPVRIKGEVTNTAGIVTIDALSSFSMDVTCDRCADEITLDFEVPVIHGLVQSLNNDENDEYILVEDMQLDLRQLTLEDIYLALPGKLLCKDDCKGLCPQCGVNLNEGSCNCQKPIDPRWAGLFDGQEN